MVFLSLSWQSSAFQCDNSKQWHASFSMTTGDGPREAERVSAGECEASRGAMGVRAVREKTAAVFAVPFSSGIRLFAKTGSGQTEGK
jgi:hypothetical protein